MEKSEATDSSLPKLICNGIRIQGPNATVRGFEEKYGLLIPRLNVSDPDGRLPLNLRRTELVERTYPFEDALASDVIRDFIAYAMVFGPSVEPMDLQIERYGTRVIYPGSSRRVSRYYFEQRDDWYYTRDGFGYLDPSILKNRAFSSVLICRIQPQGLGVPFECPSNTATVFIGADSTLGSFDQFMRQLLELGHKADLFANFSEPNWKIGGEAILAYAKRRGCRILVSEVAPERWKRSVRFMPRFLQDALREERRFGEWYLYSIGDCPATHFDFGSIAKKSRAKLQKLSVIAEVYLELKGAPPRSPVGAAWMEILKCAEIPFDLKTRREKLKSAYDELAEYVQWHEEVKQKTERTQKQTVT